MGTTKVFIYDAKTDTWVWRIDNFDEGLAQPFARVTLKRN